MPLVPQTAAAAMRALFCFVLVVRRFACYLFSFFSVSPLISYVVVLFLLLVFVSPSTFPSGGHETFFVLRSSDLFFIVSFDFCLVRRMCMSCLSYPVR